MDSEVRRTAAAHAVAGASGVSHEACGDAEHFQCGEDLFTLFDVASEVTFAVDDESWG